MRATPSHRIADAIALVGAALSLACSDPVVAPARFGPPTALHVITGDAQATVAGQLLPVPLTAQVLDATGHGVPGVTVDWSVTAGGGTLLARVFPTVTDGTGLVVVFWQLGSSPDRQSVAAACCSGQAVMFTAQALLPRAQRLSVVGGASQTDTVAGTLANPIVAQILRPDGTPDSGAIVTWSTQNGGHLSPSFARADRLGHASTMWTLGTVAGPQTGAVRANGLPPAGFVAQAMAGSPVRLAIAPRTLPLLGNIEDRAPVYAQAWDQYGNLAIDRLVLSSADTSIARISDVYVAPRHHGSTWLIGQAGSLRDSVPVTVLGFTALSDGGTNICGVSLAGDVYCWGANTHGSVGDGTTMDAGYPVQIARGLGLQLPYSEGEYNAGAHTCALDTTGRAYCWGRNESGELGDGSPNQFWQALPVPVAGGHVFSSVRAGNAHTCAVATSGDAYCWGDNNSGQLGRDTLTGTCTLSSGNRCSDWPILVASGLKFAQVSAGSFDHSCGVTMMGDAYCWGQDGWGQLGIANPPDTCQADGGATVPCSRAPRLVDGGMVFRSVKAGWGYTCGITAAGDGYCWGLGTSGQLGNGSYTSSTVPVKVTGGLAFADVQAGNGVACGLTTSGRVYCWGAGWFGATPGLVPWQVVFSSLAVGGNNTGGGHVCALTIDSDVYCWGTGPYYPFQSAQRVAAHSSSHR